MKAAHILSLIQNDYTTIGVQFKPHDKVYTYKALLADNIAVGDKVVLQSVYAPFNYAVGNVDRVDETPQIDTNAPYDYKWIIQRVDTTRHDALVSVEQRFIATVQELERKRIQQAAVAEFSASFPEGSQERRDLEELIGNSKNLLATTSATTEENKNGNT